MMKHLETTSRRIEKWQQSLLILIIGIPCAIIVSLLFSELLLPNESQPLLIVGFNFFLVIFGIIGGYFAEEEYLKTFTSFVTILYLFILFLIIISVFTGTDIFGLTQSTNPFTIVFLLLVIFVILGIVILFINLIFLLPSLFIGTLIRKKLKVG